MLLANTLTSLFTITPVKPGLTYIIKWPSTKTHVINSNTLRSSLQGSTHVMQQSPFPASILVSRMHCIKYEVRLLELTSSTLLRNTLSLLTRHVHAAHRTSQVPDPRACLAGWPQSLSWQVRLVIKRPYHLSVCLVCLQLVPLVFQPRLAPGPKVSAWELLYTTVLKAALQLRLPDILTTSYLAILWNSAGWK